MNGRSEEARKKVEGSDAETNNWLIFLRLARKGMEVESLFEQFAPSMELQIHRGRFRGLWSIAHYNLAFGHPRRR
jgi:hypothetical protein